jgi:hypothetical protein
MALRVALPKEGDLELRWSTEGKWTRGRNPSMNEARGAAKARPDSARESSRQSAAIPSADTSSKVGCAAFVHAESSRR